MRFFLSGWWEQDAFGWFFCHPRAVTSHACIVPLGHPRQLPRACCLCRSCSGCPALPDPPSALPSAWPDCWALPGYPLRALEPGSSARKLGQLQGLSHLCGSLRSPCLLLPVGRKVSQSLLFHPGWKPPRFHSVPWDGRVH